VGDTLPMKGSAKKAAEAERLVADISKRTEQLEQVKTATSRLNEAQKAMRAMSAAHDTLISHLDGFYKEVDKLAKGKTLFQVTDMILEGTNSIVRDAKAIIDSDVYIDRVKEFVAAGENPVTESVQLLLSQGLCRWSPVMLGPHNPTPLTGLGTGSRHRNCNLSSNPAFRIAGAERV
jgi:hypothetical protein